MQTKRQFTVTALKLAAGLLLALGTANYTQAADSTAAGTWAWSTPGRNGGEPRKTTLVLKVEGEKLTGKIASSGAQGGQPVETEISEGKIKGSDVSFQVVREFNGNKVTMKYSGKLEGDSIKGKIESERNGQPQSRDWEAKREAKK
jgi:hypothetical protein